MAAFSLLSFPVLAWKLHPTVVSWVEKENLIPLSHSCLRLDPLQPGFGEEKCNSLPLPGGSHSPPLGVEGSGGPVSIAKPNWSDTSVTVNWGRQRGSRL